DLCLHLYASADLDVDLQGERASLSMATNYPWDGEVALTWNRYFAGGLRLRIPSWVRRGASLSLNGRRLPIALKPGSYARLPGPWKRGDRVRLSLPMPLRRVEGHPRSHDLWGRLALMRGPLVYCAEACDNPGFDLRDIMLPRGGAGAGTLRRGPAKIGNPVMIRLPA